MKDASEAGSDGLERLVALELLCKRFLYNDCTRKSTGCWWVAMRIFQKGSLFCSLVWCAFCLVFLCTQGFYTLCTSLSFSFFPINSSMTFLQACSVIICLAAASSSIVLERVQEWFIMYDWPFLALVHVLDITNSFIIKWLSHIYLSIQILS